MTERAELIREFREFRRDHGLDTVTDFIPKNFDGLADLDEAYHANELRAEAREVKAQQQLDAMRTKSIETTQPDYVTQAELIECYRFMGEQFRQRDAQLADCMRWASVWRGGDEFKSGDVVQHAGALWICKATGTKAKPGTGPGFQLMVKRVQ